MKKSRHRRSGAVFKVLAVLITAVAILLAMSVFFKISRIDVAGAESYSPEEIIEASGIEVGENLFFVDRFGAASHIFAEAGEVPELSKELTKRERQVAELAAKGLRNAEIADALGITENTVKHNLKIIFQKMNIDRRSKLIDMLR